MTDTDPNRIADLFAALQEQLTGHDPNVTAAVVAITLHSPTHDEISVLRRMVEEDRQSELKALGDGTGDHGSYSKNQVDRLQYGRARFLVRALEAIEQSEKLIGRPGLQPRTA